MNLSIINFTVHNSAPPGTVVAALTTYDASGTKFRRIIGAQHRHWASAYIRRRRYAANSDNCLSGQPVPLYEVLNMMKKLIFTMALLVPSLAYGGNPSADLSVQVVPAGSNPIACDIGPNYTGSIPAGAQAAGFTHCAINADFTTNTNFTYNGHTYNWSNPATWLDCAGSANPIFYRADYGSTGHTLPCSDYSIVNIFGTNTLNLNYTVADATAGNQATYLSMLNIAHTAGLSLPNGLYVDHTFRLATNSYYPNSPQTTNNQNNFPSFGLFGIVCCPSASVEVDNDEVYGNGGSSLNVHDWNGSETSPYGYAFSASGTDGGYSVGYKTIGTRFSTNGTNYAVCTYVSDAQRACSASIAYRTGGATARPSWLVGLGQTDVPTTQLLPLANDMNAYIKSMVFWSCVGWATGQCNTGVFASAP
jgi:hypothetical protein